MTTSQETRCCFFCTETVTLEQLQNVSEKCPNFREYVSHYLSVNNDLKVPLNLIGSESNESESGQISDEPYKGENIDFNACGRCFPRVKMFYDLYKHWRESGNLVKASFKELESISLDDDMKPHFINRLFSKAQDNKNENQKEAEDSTSQHLPDDHGERNESDESFHTHQEASTSTSLLSPLEANHSRLSSDTNLGDTTEETPGPSSAEPPFSCSSCDLKFWSKHWLDHHTNEHIENGITQSFQIIRKNRKKRVSMATKKYLLLGKFAATKQCRRTCPSRRKILAKNKLLQGYNQNGENTTYGQNRALDLNQNSKRSIDESRGQTQDHQEPNNCELNSDAMSSNEQNSHQQS